MTTGGIAIITIGMMYAMSQLRIETGFKKQLPLKHEYMQTFLQYEKEFGGANASFLDPWGNQLMLWEHLEGIEQDEETHELVGDAKLPDGWTIE